MTIIHIGHTQVTSNDMRLNSSSFLSSFSSKTLGLGRLGPCPSSQVFLIHPHVQLLCLPPRARPLRPGRPQPRSSPPRLRKVRRRRSLCAAGAGAHRALGRGRGHGTGADLCDLDVGEEEQLEDSCGELVSIMVSISILRFDIYLLDLNMRLGRAFHNEYNKVRHQSTGFKMI